MSTADLTTRTVRLALRAICCARCHGIVPPAWAERAPNGEFRCRNLPLCRARWDRSRRIADALRAGSDDAGREVAA